MANASLAQSATPMVSKKTKTIHGKRIDPSRMVINKRAEGMKRAIIMAAPPPRRILRLTQFSPS